MPDLILPRSSIKYILYQRTHYAKFIRSRLFRAIDRRLPGAFYKLAIELEASLSSPRKISSLYMDELNTEFRSIADFLPQSCSSVLDIGCGLGLINLLVEKHYPSPAAIDYYLMDSENIDHHVRYGFTKNPSFYNSLRLAKSLLVKNGIEPNRIHLIDVKSGDHRKISQKFNLIISLISWGFHYPVEEYVDFCRDRMAPEGKLILDLRPDRSGIKLIEQAFAKVDVVSERTNLVRICATKGKTP